MKVALEILILMYLLLVTLASPKDRVKKFPDLSSEEKIGENNIKDVLQNSKDNKKVEFFRRSVQEHSLKENDQRSDYIRYHYKKPSKGDESYRENNSSDLSDSFDSSAENLESLEIGFDNDNKNSEKNKHKEGPEESDKQKHKNKKDKSTSSDSSDGSESRSDEKSFDSKKRNGNIREQFKIKLDGSDDSDSVESNSSESSSETSPCRLDENKTPLIKATLNKNESSKIKSLIRKLSKSLNNKQVLDAKDVYEINIESLIRESIIAKWQDVEIAVKLLLIDNYKYMKKGLNMLIINNTQANQLQISRLEGKLRQEYYLSKKNIIQMVKLARKEFKMKVSKSKLSKKKIHEVEQLYISQLRSGIDEKIFAFKQKIQFEIDQVKLELKSVLNYTVTHNLETTAVRNDLNTKRPSDTVYENEPISDYKINQLGVISAGHITAEAIPKSSWIETDKKVNDSDSLALLNSGSDDKSNRITMSSTIQSSKNTQKSSNPREVDNSADGILVNIENKLTGIPRGVAIPSHNIEHFSNTDISSKITRPEISASDIFPKLSHSDGINPLHSSTTVKNEQNTDYFMQEHSSQLLFSNAVKTNGNKINIGSEIVQPKLLPADNNELVKSKSQLPTIVYSYVTQHPRIDNTNIEPHKNGITFQSLEAKLENGIVPLNSKTTTEANEISNLSISDVFITDHTNLQRENITSRVNRNTTMAESEINVDLRNNSTKPAINNYNVSNALNNSSNLDNKITWIKNITTENHNTPNAENSYKLNETDVKDHTSTTNNKSNKALSDNYSTDISLPVDKPIETAQDNSIIKNNQINKSDQRHVIDITLSESTTTKVSDFIYSANGPVAINETDSPREKKEDPNVAIRENETIDSTNVINGIQYAHNGILTETTTNSDSVTLIMDNSDYNSNLVISQNNDISVIVNDTQNLNNSQTQEIIDITSTNFTANTTNGQESRYPSNSNYKIKIRNLTQEIENVTLNNNESENMKHDQNTREVNIILTQSAIPTVNNHTSNITFNNPNEIYDSLGYESTYNVTNGDSALHNNSIKDIDKQPGLIDIFSDPIANSSIKPMMSNNDITTEFPHSTQNINEDSPNTITYDKESSSNLEVQSLKHTIPTNATENVENEGKSAKPINGNIENLSTQSNIDVIPHDVKSENDQNMSDVNKIPRMKLIATGVDIKTTDYSRVAKSIDVNSQPGNSHTEPTPETNFELQNVEDKKNLVNIIKHETTYKFESESTTLGYLNNESQTTETIIHFDSTNKTDVNDTSIISENEKISSTDIPVTDTIVDENIVKKSSNLSISTPHSSKNHSLNGTLEPLVVQPIETSEISFVTNKNNDEIIEYEFEKTSQINSSESEKYRTEMTTPFSVTTMQQPLNETVFNDSAKIILNKISTTDSISYSDDEIATNPTKIPDSGYPFIGTTSSLDITTNADFYTEPKVKESTKSDIKIIDSSTSTPQIDSERLQSTFAPAVTNEKGATDIIREKTNMSTTLMSNNNVDTKECTDMTGAIIDCESLIVSSLGNNGNTNIDSKNKKSIPNIWPGIPHECIPLFLASDGTVLKEIPSIVEISDAQTRNLCVSIAITIIKLNS